MQINVGGALVYEPGVSISVPQDTKPYVVTDSRADHFGRQHGMPWRTVDELWAYQQNEPATIFLLEFWLYRGRVVRLHLSDSDWEELLMKGPDGYAAFRDPDLVRLKIKHAVLKDGDARRRLESEVETLEKLDRIPVEGREPISREVRMFVWQRDKGRCVGCGSPEKLEFDHVIPVTKGGSNTERNIQLLCERCNRSKGANL